MIKLYFIVPFFESAERSEKCEAYMYHQHWFNFELGHSHKILFLKLKRRWCFLNLVYKMDNWIAISSLQEVNGRLLK